MNEPIQRRRYTKHDNPCIEKAHDDEPLFVLRSTDAFAPDLVARWIETVEAYYGEPTPKTEDARGVLQDMREWQADNGELVKAPD